MTVADQSLYIKISLRELKVNKERKATALKGVKLKHYY